MAIPEQFVDEVVQRTELVDLVSEYVHLTKKGGSYWGCCPFHGEKTPSFHVLPDRQMYKCFGCGKGGGTISFMMEIEHLPFPDAVRALAKRANMTVPESGGGGRGMRERRARLLEINRQAARAFHRWLYDPRGRAGLDYLRARGLSRATLTNFGLGFAPDSWDALMNELSAQGYEKREILEAGLIVNNDKGRFYDRFRNRVMFPIIDLQGEVIGFGGRVMDDATPKYLNSPDTPVYNKTKSVFALNRARKSKAGQVILTEGYMDTIALHQAGFDNAVASLGTSLTADHAHLLARYFKSAILSYDGDEAGVKAAQRAIPILEKAGLKVRVLRVREAKDPDEFIKRYGRQAFQKLLEGSENQIDYLLGQIAAKYQMEDDAQRVEFLREATQLLAARSDAVEREIYAGHAAQMAKVSKQTVEQEVAKALGQRLGRERRQRERQETAPLLQPAARTLRYGNLRSAGAEEGVLRLCMLQPELLSCTGTLRPEEFSAPLLGKVFAGLKRRGGQGGLSALAGDLEPEEMDHVAHVLSKPEALENGQKSLHDYIEIIQSEAQRKLLGDGDEALRLAQRRYQKKKAYMEETP